MQASRRWVPGHARRPRPAAEEAVPAGPVALLRPQDVSGKDLAFCAEFAVHGGLAVSEQGFKGEGDLIRMQQAGLLDLERDPAPPFALLRVSLSGPARALLSGNQQGRAASPADEPHPPVASGIDECALRRNGFEVARGMIGAAVKAGAGGLERAGSLGRRPRRRNSRIMTRISKIEAPFKP